MEFHFFNNSIKSFLIEEAFLLEAWKFWELLIDIFSEIFSNLWHVLREVWYFSMLSIFAKSMDIVTQSKNFLIEFGLVFDSKLQLDVCFNVRKILWWNEFWEEWNEGIDSLVVNHLDNSPHELFFNSRFTQSLSNSLWSLFEEQYDKFLNLSSDSWW